jgi:hypothetical protein
MDVQENLPDMIQTGLAHCYKVVLGDPRLPVIC